MPFVKKCPFLRQKIEEDVRVLDYRHSSLLDLPSEVFDRERTLEELYADCNQIKDLPRELFYCQGLRKLSISDNEITSIPPAISSLTNLQELDFSKNGIIEVPDNIKSCKYLRSVDASVNPLGRLPEGFTHLPNLTHLCLNDTFLDYLPGSFGRMVTLTTLELRENHLKTLPRSFSRLVHLERLDIGNNEFTELSDVIGGLTSLLELWCDNNQITTFANNIGNLKQLMFLDASYNQLQTLPMEIEGCSSLADLHLTSNNLVKLPPSIGNLVHLTTLKVDDNHLTCLPPTLGDLSSLSELNISSNSLQELPPSIGRLRNLRTFYADENILRRIPSEVGSCSGITVLSLRSNKLTYIPDELGRIPGLRVLNLSDNLLRFLPFSIVKLKDLQALWLTDNQTRPLIPLQSEYDGETDRKILTCYLLPQGHMMEKDKGDSAGDNESFHSSMWEEERHRRQQIHFDFIETSDERSSLIRCPTPYPKDMRDKVRHAHNLALRRKVNEGEIEVTSITATHSTSGTFVQAGAETLNHSKFLEHSQSHIKEARIARPTSCHLADMHRLYMYDKDKLWKDKVRMQHSLSSPDCGSNIRFLLHESKNSHKIGGGMSLSGSVPDLAAAGGEAEAGLASASTCTYSDLYNTRVTSRHKGRRSRPVREYDSDTGYRSDGELMCVPAGARDLFSSGAGSDRLSMWSQPLPHHNVQQPRGRGRRGMKITSDVEGYAGGSTFPTANAAAAAFQRQIHVSLNPQSITQTLHRGAQSSAVVAASSINNSRCAPSKPGANQYHNIPLNSTAGISLISQPSMTSASHHVMTLTSPTIIAMNSQPDRTLTSRQGGMDHVSDRFQSSASSNHSRRSHLKLASIVSNDQMYSHSSISRHHESAPVTVSGGCDDSPLNLLSSSRSETEQAAATSLRPLAGSQVRSKTLVDTVTYHQHRPISARLPSPHSEGRGDLSPAVTVGSSNVRDILLFQATSPCPVVFGRDSCVETRTYMFNQTKRAASGLSGGGQAEVDTLGETSSSPQASAAAHYTSMNSQAHEYGHTSASPPPFIPTPQYRRAGGSSPGACTNRLTHDSWSSSPVVLPHSTSYMSISTGDNSSANLSSGVSHLSLKQAQSPTCGFHGNNPFASLPGPSRAKLNSPQGMGQGDCHGLAQPRTTIFFKDNDTSRSGSSSSQLMSASQVGQIYPVEVQSRRLADAQRLNQSNCSDSPSDLHNLTFARDSPHSGVSQVGLAQATFSQDMTYSHCAASYNKTHDDEDNSRIFANQEHYSQVSSSTDSGYSQGQSVMENVGDYHGAIRKLNVSSHMLDVTAIPSTRGHTSVTTHTNTGLSHSASTNVAPDCAPHKHTCQFRVTIHKNPGLGFSITGGLASHGNPFNKNDIGIFVTKVSRHGPAWKVLRPGDKLLQVNNVDFRAIEHQQAVSVLTGNTSVHLLLERIQTANLV